MPNTNDQKGWKPIEFKKMPGAMLSFLMKHLHLGKVSQTEMAALATWARSGPTAPPGEWYKELGSDNFYFAGKGAVPTNFLPPDAAPWRMRLAKSKAIDLDQATKMASEDEWVNAPPTLDELIGDLGIHHFNGLPKTSIRVKYNALMKLYNSGKAITVYRALSAADIRKIKREGFGTFWSWSEDGAKVYYPETEGDPTHVFQGEVDRNDVDWYQTCSMLANSEREIRVQDGAQVSIIGWRRDGETAWQEPPPEMKVVTAARLVR